MTSKQVCPNDDPSFTKMLYKMGMLQRYMSPKEVVAMRMRIYYCICIIVRAALIVAVYHWRNSLITRVLVFVGAMLGVVTLGSRMNGTQWWSKKFQFIMSIIIGLAVILTHFKVIDSRAMSVAMLVSLTGGVAQSFAVRFC
jgi:glucose-6-phosphate-specific signal transduction histidine kinase